VPLEGLSGLLGSADAHLLSMRPGLEGMLVPSKVYGIMAAGRPAIMVGSTENEAARLLLRSGAGFVVPVGDAAAICSAVRLLMDEPRLAHNMGRAGRRCYDAHLGRDRSVATIARELTGARVLPLPLPSGIMPAPERRRKSA
jgi:colanic acid biosynthesis glycosyl transferase WcaI